MRPLMESSVLRSSSARSSTTVLATESARPNTRPAPNDQPQSQRHQAAEAVADRDLPHRTGDGDLADRHQVVDRKVQADAEHQQDDADFRQLARQRLVTDEPRRERPDRHAGQQVADEGRQAQLGRDETAGESHHQAHGNDGDKVGLVRHRQSRVAAPRK